MAREADRQGLRSKRHLFASGRVQGGHAFKRGQIYTLLRNPVYLGLICHKDKVHPGTHDAIIDQNLWDRVQSMLQAASARRRGQGRATDRSGDQAGIASLTGRIQDETGDLLTPTHTRRHGRRLRLYISNRLISGGTDATGWRLPAQAFEDAIAKVIADHLAQQAGRHAVLAGADMADSVSAADKTAGLAAHINAAGIAKARGVSKSYLTRVLPLACLSPGYRPPFLTAPTRRLQDGLSLGEVSQLFGHASITQTQKYAKYEAVNTVEKAKQALNRASEL